MSVHADNIWKQYGRFDALRGLSFSVPEGSVFALFGANGAGKTTTIKVLVNLIEPTMGDATVLGANTRALSPKELAQIGYVSENQDMPGRMTVSAYIDYLPRSIPPGTGLWKQIFWECSGFHRTQGSGTSPTACG
jgi:ABC-2 type transport system ATP-binding protein